jgi:hypothetical protein
MPDRISVGARNLRRLCHGIGQMPANAARANSMVGHWLDVCLANTIAGNGLRSAADTVFGKPMVEVLRIIAHRAAELEIHGAGASAAQLVEGRSRKAEICGGAANRKCPVDFWSGHRFSQGRLVCTESPEAANFYPELRGVSS